MKKLSPLLIVPALALVIAGCGSSKSSSTSTAASTPAAAASTATASTPAANQISAKSVPNVGTVLVNAKGHTLYVFLPDKHKSVTCTGSCAQVWPPLKLSTGQQASAGAGVSSALLSSAPDPEGGQVATYAGWPLYTYVADTGPGVASGQGLDINGGYWYAISPSGKVTK